MNLNYKQIGEAITIGFSDENVTLLQIGVIGAEFHKLLNQVAIAVIETENNKLQKSEEPLIEFHIPQSINRDDILIKGQLKGLRYGSIEIDIAAFVATSVFSQQGSVAILQNIAANVIWALSVYAIKVKGCKITKIKSTQLDHIHLPKNSSRKQIGPIVTKVLNALKESNNGGKFKFKSGDEEIEIEFYSSNAK